MTFDAAARSYDRDFTDTSIGQWLRQIIWQRLTQHFGSGDFVLEIGCGTGEDACFLASRGVNILATDVSVEMRRQTESKASSVELTDKISTQHLDLNHLPTDESRMFDGAYSNFGPMNCTSDMQLVAEWLAARIRSGGVVGFGIMPPFCLWETLWHGLHLDFKTATRRWNGCSMATLEDGSTFQIYYPSVRYMRRVFAPQFEVSYVQGVGLWLPPSDVYAVIEKHPRLLAILQKLECRSAGWWPFRNWSDHYWIELRRTEITSP